VKKSESESKYYRSDIDREFERYFDINDITIIVPTLNEEHAIGLVLEEILQQGYENILVVDGNSSDNTVKEAEKFNVKVIKQEGKGKTGAVKTAIKHVKTPYIALLDGDCTYSSKDIEKLVPYLGYNYEVIGARTKGRENISLLNRFGNWVINQVFNILFGAELTDVCSGLYILQTEFARGIELNTLGFEVEVEIAAQAALDSRVEEVPISFSSRVGTQKLQPFRDGMKIMITMMRLAKKYYPINLFAFISLLLFFPGVLILFTLINSSLGYMIIPSSIGVLLVVLALQGLTILLVNKDRARKKKLMNRSPYRRLVK
jgi:dolichol-phosphate mannosyltransferase